MSNYTNEKKNGKNNYRTNRTNRNNKANNIKNFTQNLNEDITSKKKKWNLEEHIPQFVFGLIGILTATAVIAAIGMFIEMNSHSNALNNIVEKVTNIEEKITTIEDKMTTIDDEIND